MSTKKFKAKDLKGLRNKSKKDLLKQIDELKNELHSLRVAQVSGGAPAKVANIKTVRKNIARIHTTISQITKERVRAEYKKKGATLLPLDLRPRLTRRERLRLPQNLRFKKTSQQKKMIKKYPQRKFAVINLGRKLPIEARKLNLRYALNGKQPSDEYYKHFRRSQKLRRALRKKADSKKRVQKARSERAKRKTAATKAAAGTGAPQAAAGDKK